LLAALVLLFAPILAACSKNALRRRPAVGGPPLNVSLSAAHEPVDVLTAEMIEAQVGNQGRPPASHWS
jgi:hypothetical protein